MNKKLSVLFLALLLLNKGFLFAQDPGKNKPLQKLLFFHSPTCHSCIKTKEEIIPGISREFSGLIEIEYLDTTDINNYRLMLAVKQKYNCDKPGVPSILVGKQVLVGYDQIKAELKEAIICAIKEGRQERFDMLPGIDLAGHFLSFGALAIAFAGLIDGINPCAFTVIVFFISFLTLQGYKKRELVTIGLAFILAVFSTYILIGLGIFRSLYSLSQFYLISKAVYYFIAGFSFVLGGLALYDLWLYIRSADTAGMILQLPKSVKNRIHAVIGMHYRKKPGSPAQEHRVWRLAVGAFVTGFLISILEAVCTGQLYLPTITFVLKDPALRLRAAGYLLLYNFMFIIPLVIIFLSALFGATSLEFGHFMKKRMALVKILMALVFFGMGFFILRNA